MDEMRPVLYDQGIAQHVLRPFLSAKRLRGQREACECPGLRGCDAAAHGDVVLARKDVPASYHLCVTHDDARQGVTLVTRGADLRPATAIHRLLQALLGWPEPDYAHHALLSGVDGRRLAKRDGAPSLRSLREGGLTPAEVSEMTAPGTHAGGPVPHAAGPA